MVRPRGRRHGRYVVVVPLHACSLMLGSIVPRVIDVRCGAVLHVGLLYSLCCSVVVPSLTPCLIQYVYTFLKKIWVTSR
jgi:hypothetical protein